MRTSTSFAVIAASSTFFAAASPIPANTLESRQIRPTRPYVASGGGNASSGNSGDVSGGNVVNQATGAGATVSNGAGSSESHSYYLILILTDEL